MGDSEPKSRRWILAAIGTLGALAVRGADEATRIFDDLAARADELTARWEEIRPEWFGKARWALKLGYGVKITMGKTKKGQLTLSPENYAKFELETKEDGTLRYEIKVKQGPNVDVFLFEPAAYRSYLEQTNAEYVREGTRLNTRAGSAETRLGLYNQYYLVCDNTPMGVADPENQPVDIEYSIRLRPM